MRLEVCLVIAEGELTAHSAALIRDVSVRRFVEKTRAYIASDCSAVPSIARASE